MVRGACRMATPKINSITDIDSNFLNPVAALPWVERIWLFGSRARGDHHARSDIDLTVECPQATTDEWYITLHGKRI